MTLLTSRARCSFRRSATTRSIRSSGTRFLRGSFMCFCFACRGRFFGGRERTLCGETLFSDPFGLRSCRGSGDVVDARGNLLDTGGGLESFGVFECLGFRGG
jgi:hypothetical protein